MSRAARPRPPDRQASRKPGEILQKDSSGKTSVNIMAHRSNWRDRTALDYNCVRQPTDLPRMNAKRTSTGRPGAIPACAGAPLRLLWAVVSVLLRCSHHCRIRVPARVLEQDDLARIARIKPLFIEVLTDVSQSAQRPDLVKRRQRVHQIHVARADADFRGAAGPTSI